MLRLTAAESLSDLTAATSAAIGFTATALGGMSGGLLPWLLDQGQRPKAEGNGRAHGSSRGRQRLQDQQREAKQRSWPTLASMTQALEWLVLPPTGSSEGSSALAVPPHHQHPLPAACQEALLGALAEYLDRAGTTCLSGSREILRRFIDLLGSSSKAVRKVRG